MGRSILHIMLKLARGLCNLQCRYCCYVDETAKREVGNWGIMFCVYAEECAGQGVGRVFQRTDGGLSRRRTYSGRTQFF